MSMNLHCNRLKLWQTPTHITRMCLLCSDPVSQLKAYRYWVLSHMDGVYNSEEEWKSKNEVVMAHCKEVDKLIENPGELELFEM